MPIKKLEFAIEDEGNFVKAFLADGGKILLDYENKEAKPVRVRVPIPTKEKIIENAKYWIAKDKRWKTLEDQVNFYIKCREKEIFGQIQEIRKCLKKIQRNTLCAKIAKDALKEYPDI